MFIEITPCISVFFICSLSEVHSANISLLEAKFREYHLISDVLTKLPTELCSVIYPDIETVNLGNEILPRRIKQTLPIVKWTTEPDALYTLAMVDPDAPQRFTPRFREWQHWLVGNIPGNDVDKGETLSPYIGPGPPLGVWYHRYTFLIYKQPGKVDYSEEPRLNFSDVGRTKFKIAKFAEKYNLSGPVAGNFYVARWDYYVPELWKIFKG